MTLVSGRPGHLQVRITLKSGREHLLDGLNSFTTSIDPATGWISCSWQFHRNPQRGDVVAVSPAQVESVQHIKGGEFE
jgi:hypothetical protein